MRRPPQPFSTQPPPGSFFSSPAAFHSVFSSFSPALLLTFRVTLETFYVLLNEFSKPP